MGNHVLVMDLDDPLYKMHIEYIDESEIPERLNGESGKHIYHVRVMTERILRQLAENGVSFTEQEINDISLASSLHDIGKTQIPQDFLNRPGKLSATEYECVKTHTVLGADLINQASVDRVAPEVLYYAREIALGHHERFDGSGYPKGISGDEIPIYIQAVALADTYDALTSKRQYKQEFTADVALQMISSGMCGGFDEQLVEVLAQVIHDHELDVLREQIQQNRSVSSDVGEDMPKRILCIGNTEYLTKEFLNQTFPDSKKVVVGNKTLKSSSHIKSFRMKKPSVKSLFDTYEFDAVVYFSRELTYDNREESDSRYLQEVLKYAAEVEASMKFLYLSSLEAAFFKEDAEAILIASKEKLCMAYAENSSIDMKVIRIPHLYCGGYEQDFLFKIFERIRKGKTICLKENPQNPLRFLSMQDLSNLLGRIFESWSPGGGILSVGESFGLTFSDLAEALKKLYQCEIVFVEDVPLKRAQVSNKFLRKYYGWFALVSILEELTEQHELYQSKLRLKDTSLKDKVKGFLRRHHVTVGVVELVLLFILTEFLLQFTDSAVVFSVVDFRMAYIVIMALTHGIYFGLGSAALCSASWFVAKVMSGVNWLTIFYEPTNWLAFVYFFLIGGLCGYVKLRSDDKIRFNREERHLLEEKLIFTREIYEDTYREKRDLKRQIIGSKDSFGKIFDITRKLDTVELHLLYLRTVEAFETILENKSITIYSVNEKSTFGRLEVASRKMLDTAARSISLEKYTSVIEGTADGEIWRNVQLDPELPMFAAGIYRDGKLVLLIFLWKAKIEQRTLYYANLFKILKDLVQMSLLRALQYNQAIYETQYIPGTSILNSETFEKLLGTFRKLNSRKLSEFVLLEIDTRNHSLEEAEVMLSKKIRQNDSLGLTKNGKLCLLLSQASEKNLNVILPRFDELDLSVKILK